MTFKNTLLIILQIFVINALLSSCSTTQNTPNETDKELFIVNISCIDNQMPLSNSLPYVIIEISPKEGIFTENILVTKLVAKGQSGKWNATLFDQAEYTGKDQNNYNNNARNFDASIGSPYIFELTLQTESGVIQKYVVENVTVQVVY